MSSLQTKADHRDIDSLSQKLHGKADHEKLQMLMGEIRQEVTTSLGTVKKEAQLAHKKRDEDGRSLRNDFEVAHVKSVKEMGSIQDKLQRLAAQFDKELMARDKQMKQFKNMSQEDMQRAVQGLSTDMEMFRKQMQELEVRKAEKRDLLDHKQKGQLSLDQKIDKAEVHGLLSDFTADQAQKSFGFRKELFEKISSIQQDITTSVAQFV